MAVVNELAIGFFEFLDKREFYEKFLEHLFTAFLKYDLEYPLDPVKEK